ncbi:B-cell antigen receptor complex-associated protein beta chain [Brachyistius frenatus]|uniref:B-cell antigen receptor complex-associated protein beta chain n=1 Tax=Brachyistius frenatus TaxID=100188 RepID=UPI0037E82F57
MRWMLAGCCGLALINLSVALNDALVKSQKPRFIGVKTGRSVAIYCKTSEDQECSVEWYKADKYDVPEADRKRLQPSSKVEFVNKTMLQNAYLYLLKIQPDDSGVYFCKINKSWGPGTKLQAAIRVNQSNLLYRSNMKDGLIIFQGLLLAVCIAAVLLRKQKLLEKSDSIYEEPETDHIYEGLAIETCGGDLYEELAVYSLVEGTEAPWE